MKKSAFTKAQTAFVLKQAEAGMAVGEAGKSHRFLAVCCR